MRHLPLGQSGLGILVIGLGCMGMSEFYSPADAGDCERMLDRALDLGMTHLDTADMYGFGANEAFLGGFLAAKGRRSQVVLASKFGVVRDPADPHSRNLDIRPEYVARACDASLKRLRTDRIDLYYAHRLDPAVPVEDTVGAMAALVRAGKARAIGSHRESLPECAAVATSSRSARNSVHMARTRSMRPVTRAATPTGPNRSARAVQVPVARLGKPSEDETAPSVQASVVAAKDPAPT